MRGLLILGVFMVALWASSSGCDRSSTAADKGGAAGGEKPATGPATTQSSRVERTDDEWKKLLSPEQYRILRQKGTERAFTGQFWNHHELGTYICAGCGLELFISDTKFDSGCGWPSFFQAVAPGRIKEQVDNSHGMVRTEVLCAQCGGHLGHVFNDGPRDKTGLRYCINSGAMKFIPAAEKGPKKESPK